MPILGYSPRQWRAPYSLTTEPARQAHWDRWFSIKPMDPVIGIQALEVKVAMPGWAQGHKPTAGQGGASG
ncbi:hypothetical protein HaLaN_09254 [Haematococcus lacustris]|uniref:Uncharacterized protein n=1 Tax=Haematococcus lacustris TaxID=44745 RepID=A0A699YU86_HAELA|nr:hypothetical protein HaLaN_09254 [Haematococcus lacustris]